MELAENSRKIFEFKGLIGKIFRNKDLATSLQLLHPVSTPIGKGAGVVRTLLLSIILLYQSQPIYPDNFSNFIFPANTSTYAENRRNGGLTGFPEIEKWGTRKYPPAEPSG